MMKKNLIYPSSGEYPFSKGIALLEALVAILILAIGILGLIGLQSRAMSHVDESGYRSSAVSLAGAYAAELWAVGAKGADLSSYEAGSGEPYEAFKGKVWKLPLAERAAELLGVDNPTVAVEDISGSRKVVIEIFWLMPSDPDDANSVHRYRQETFLSYN